MIQVNVRLLTPDKKGIARKLTAAVESVGGKVENLHVSRKMRGMNETSFRMTLPAESMKGSALEVLGEIPGVALLEATDLPSA